MQLKKLLTYSIALCFSSALIAQKPYFQQEVNITMDVKLEDSKHQVAGDWKMEYINNSPDTLPYIYIHLYPNAYKNNRTALAKQIAQQNNKKSWHFEADTARGFIANLEFKDKNGQAQKWEYDEKHIDIAKIYLSHPLAPNDTLILTTPFLVQLPKTISRLGHVGESYQLTQWYPKPAVYDHKGWHQMPYLDQGEFYAEFGAYDVKITVPTNYIVGASGDLQTASEKAFLDSLAQLPIEREQITLKNKNTEFPLSKKETKTLHYTLKNVHDFAWFADKRFHVRKDSVQLASGRWVTTWAMFTDEEKDLWLEATHYLNRSIKFYSDIVGEYPYNVCTAVQSALSAGAGMEYPTITVIGKSYDAYSLDQVITHEVGHNWFYGILANNERMYPWMDEGWNSYIENRYTDTYYGEAYGNAYFSMVLQAHRGKEQPINTPADEATYTNYYVTAYAKPTLAFRHLERYLGTEKMDIILKKYFETWKFKHPYPEDLRTLIEAETGESMAWLFDIVIGTAKRVDYGIKNYKYENNRAELTIVNKGDAPIIFSLGGHAANDKIITEQWFSFNGKDTTIILENLPENVQSFEINAYAKGQSLDVNLSNNKAYVNKSAKNFKINLGLNAKNIYQKSLNIIPILGSNVNDGFMLGLAAYNLPVPLKKWQYYIAPLYGFRSQQVVGSANLEYNHYNSNAGNPDVFRGFTLGLNYKAFNYNRREIEALNTTYDLRYDRFNLYGILWLPRKVVAYATEHYLMLENLLISEQYAQFNFDSIGLNGVSSNNRRMRSTHRITHVYNKKHPFSPYSFKTELTYANYESSNAVNHFIKLSTTAEFSWTYLNNKTIDFRLFAGGFIYNTDRDFGAMPLQMASRNINDYHYDGYFGGRNRQTGFWSNQIMLQEGGFKTPLAASVADGHSNSFLMSMNLKFSLPFGISPIDKVIKIKPYLDAGYFLNTEPSMNINGFKDQFMWNGGFMIEFGQNIGGIYFPLVGSSNIMNQTKSLGNFGKRISFAFNIDKLYKNRVFRNIDL